MQRICSFSCLNTIPRFIANQEKYFLCGGSFPRARKFYIAPKRSITISPISMNETYQKMNAPVLKTVLDDKDLIGYGSFITNKFVSDTSKSDLKVINPANGTVIHRLSQASEPDVEEAIKSSTEAQKQWARKSIQERSQFISNWLHRILASKQDLAKIITLENGKPLAEAEKEVDYAASFLSWAAQKTLHSNCTHAVDVSHSTKSFVTHEPIGVVYTITPWNFPLAMLARKVAPAIGAGCAVIAKPSELTPLAALALAELAQRAGAPPGLFNVLVTDSPQKTSSVVFNGSSVRMVSFTGSTNVGKLIMRQAADRVLRVTLENGGHAPFIVFDDADLKLAVNELISSKFRCAAQACISPNRIFVHERISELFIKSLKERLEKLKIGNGMNEDVDIGPLINSDAVEKVDRHVNDALKKGAKMLFKTETIEQVGTYCPIVLLDNVCEGMIVMEEETFGPLIGICKFNDDDDIVMRANSEYAGLVAYVFSQDLSKAMRMSRDLEYGMVGINCTQISNAATEFGGMKESGLGREGGMNALEHFMETKHTYVSY